MKEKLVQLVRVVLYFLGGWWFVARLMEGMNIIEAAYLPVIIIGIVDLLLLRPLKDSLASQPQERVANTIKLGDQNRLAKIARQDKDKNVRRAAVMKLTDQDILAKIAKQDENSRIRKAARIRLESLRSKE